MARKLAAKNESSKARGASEVHVALLRGVNVGGKNRLRMADLVAMFEQAGCREVVTYIQSGNVIFEANAARMRGLSSTIGQALLAQLGNEIPLVLRTAEELRALARANPFLAAGAAPDQFHVAFLKEAPSAAQVASLDVNRSKPDAFVVRGREIFLHFPNGVAKTRFTNDYFDRTLKTTSTVRNWRTVLALLELATE